MNFTFITDEAAQEPREFIELAEKYRIRSVELRSVQNQKVSEMNGLARKELKKILDDAGLSVCCLDSFVFKGDIDGNLQLELDKLKIAIENALWLKAPLIRIFTFLRRPDREVYYQRILDAVLKAGEITDGSGVKLAIENCRKTMNATGAELGELFKNLKSDVFTVLWDPANSQFCRLDPAPVKNGYPIVAERISHVHLKDPYVPESGESEYVTLGRGHLDLKGQLMELSKRNYNGYLSLETHWRPNRKMNLTEFDLPGGQDFSNSGYEATDKDLSTVFSIFKSIMERHDTSTGIA
jgi:L-ribulose-5-phosphate 3-epimerase